MLKIQNTFKQHLNFGRYATHLSALITLKTSEGRGFSNELWAP